MQNQNDGARDRRALLKNGLVLATTLAMPGTVLAAARWKLEWMYLLNPEDSTVSS